MGGLESRSSNDDLVVSELTQRKANPINAGSWLEGLLSQVGGGMTRTGG